MYFKIFFTLIILAIISSGVVFAQNSLISVQTDSLYYDEGDTILISGTVNTIIGNTPVTLQLFKDANLVQVAQFELSQDGNYSHTIIAEGSQWKREGEYIVKVVYGDGNIAESSFSFKPGLKTVSTTNIFSDIAIDDGGTFDINYSITGGTVESIVVDTSIFGLIVQIDATSNGRLVLDLPRQFIESKQGGMDVDYIILIDDVQTYNSSEQKLDSKIRTVIIDFEQNDSEIQLIGTYVIPEFGTLVMIILTIGILSSILLTKNRLHIKI